MGILKFLILIRLCIHITDSLGLLVKKYFNLYNVKLDAFLC